MYGSPEGDNLYSCPGNKNLTLLGIIDDPAADYSFDMIGVWQTEDGRVFYAQDAGCSCPSPFEDSMFDTDFIEVTAYNWNDFQAAVDGHCYHGNGPDPAAADKTDLLRKVSALVPPKNWHYIYNGVDNDPESVVP